MMRLPLTFGAVRALADTLATDRAPSLALDYHFFNNTYNSFVFLFPHGEAIASRATIVERPRR